MQQTYTKEDVAHIYNGILLSHKKVNNNIYSNIDEPTDYHTKWCKSERERKIPYDISYLRNLKNYINAIKLQSSRPYGTGTETEIQINGTRQKVQR